MSESLIRDLLWCAEHLRERALDDVRDCKVMGSEDGALENLKLARSIASTIRAARIELKKVTS